MRRSTPRSKTGCQTCRIRHVKCDETKPSCLKCTTTGRKCDGYTAGSGRSAAIASRQPGSTAPADSSTSLVSITAYSIPFRMPGSQEDRRLLHYYCVQGLQEFTGFVRNEFWSRTALYTSQNESIVRQSLLALSSLHLNLSRTAPGLEANRESLVGKETLVRYGKALRSLQARINKVDQTREARSATARTALICCVLFYCFESYIGDNQAAIRHLGNGLQLLATSQQLGNMTDEEMTSIKDILARLDMQATCFDDTRTPVLTLLSPQERRSGFIVMEDGDPKDIYHNLAEAQRDLNKLQNWLLHFFADNKEYNGKELSSIDEAVLAEKSLLTSQYNAFKTKYDNYMQGIPKQQKPPATAPAEESSKNPNELGLERAAHTILAQYVIARMLLDSRIPDNPEVFGDVPNARAQAIVQACDKALLLGDTEEAALLNQPAVEAHPAHRILSTETGVVVPLFLVAMKCADHDVIDDAVKLLAVSQRREGLYDAMAVAILIRQLQNVRHRRSESCDSPCEHAIEGRPLESWVGDLIRENPIGAINLAQATGQRFGS